MPTVLEELHHVSISPGRDKPVFTSPVDEACFSKAEEDNEYDRQAKATDLAFFLRRQDPEIKPSWTVFNQSLSSEEREHTTVGYLPIILAPAHEFDTLNTVVKRCMAISSRFGQEHTVITVDQALYYRLMELKWSLLQYQDKLFPRLGGLHVSMHFLKAIWDHMNGSGLADVWGEMGLLGPGAVELVLQERHTTNLWEHTNWFCKSSGVSWCQASSHLLQRRTRTVMLVFQWWLLMTTHRRFQNW